MIVEYALAVIPDIVARIETELVEATNPTNGGSGKPTSRPPAPIGPISDLREARERLLDHVEDWCELMNLNGPLSSHWTVLIPWLTEHWRNAQVIHPDPDSFADTVTHRHTRNQPEDPNQPNCPDGCLLGVYWILARNDPSLRKDREWIPWQWGCPTIDPETGPCNGTLERHASEYLIRCPRCRTHWTEDQFERLALILGCELEVTVDQAAQWAKVHPSTIYRWIETRRLPVTESGLIDKWNLVAYVTRRHATG